MLSIKSSSQCKMASPEPNKCESVSIYIQKSCIPCMIVNIYDHETFKLLSPTKCDKWQYQVDVNLKTFLKFIALVNQSTKFRSQILEMFKKPHTEVLVNIDDLPNLTIDYIGGGILQGMVTEKMLCDTAMSYLSTLGGAFSSLGDYSSYCAEKAGEISLKQFRIALRVGDETLAARCRLYMALSLMQRGLRKPAKELIIKQYSISKKYKDNRLGNMCHGVWSKLQYTFKEQRKSVQGL